MWSDARKKSHVGILAKEKADAAAKSALSLSVTDEASFHRPVSSYNKADTWSGRKLHAIRPTVCDYKQKTCLSHRYSVLLNRLRILCYGRWVLFHGWLAIPVLAGLLVYTWLLTRPVVNFTLRCSDKSNTSPEIFKHRFYELCHEFKNYYRIFTDGSKKVTSKSCCCCGPSRQH